MQMLRFTVRSMPVLLGVSAMLGAAVCGMAGVGVLPSRLVTVEVFGRPHTSLGSAGLGITPDGGLLISNIGSSGQDGVSIDFGDVSGVSLEIDFGDAGALPQGEIIEIYEPHAWRDACVYVKALVSGGGECGLGGPGAEPWDYTVTILDGGTIVDNQKFDQVPQNGFARGDLGSDPATGTPMRFEYTRSEWDHVHTLTLPAPTLLTITDSLTGPVMGNQIRITMHGLPPGDNFSAPVRVIGTSPTASSFEISGEELLITGRVEQTSDFPLLGFATTNPTARVSVNGAASVTGIVTPFTDVLDPSWRDPISPPTAVLVSNIGSSGLDGVTVEYRDRDGCSADCTSDESDSLDLNLTDENELTGSVYFDFDGEGLEISATGHNGNNPNWDFGSTTIRNEFGTVNLYADYGSVGSDLVRVEVYELGAFVGEFEVFNQPGLALADLGSPTGRVGVRSCGKLTGDILFPPCYVWRFGEPIFVTGVGFVFVGDEVRVLAASATASVDTIDTMTVRAMGLSDFAVSTCGPSLLHVSQGLRTLPMGAATLSNDVGGNLRVSNIGSSGEDGVAIDLGESTGGSFLVDPATTFLPFNITDFDYGYRGTCCGDPPDDLCVGRVSLDATTPSSVLLTASGNDPATPLQVTLRNGSETITGSFSIASTDMMTLGDPAGIGIELARVDVDRRAAAGGGYLECFVCHFVADPGGGGGSGVTVQDPFGLAYPGVTSIEICQASPVVSVSSDLTVLLTQRNTLIPPGDFTLRTIMARAAGTPTIALGEARMGLHFNEDLIGVSTPRVSVGNIGSSGQDGVSFDLTEGVCNGIDDDCDGVVDETASVFSMTIEDINPSIPLGDVEISMNKVDMVDDEELLEIGTTVRNIGTAPSTSEYEVRLRVNGVFEPFVLDVVVRDAAGNTIASENGALFPDVVGSAIAAISPRKRKISVESLIRAGESPGGVPTLEGLTQEFSWDEDTEVTLSRTGQLVPAARSLEFTMSLRSFPVFDAKDKGVVYMASPAGTTGSYLISDIVLDNPPPPCPADLNNDGFLDSGDITGFVAGFLASDPAVDFNNDGFHDSGDISAFVAAFLAGC